MSGPESSDSPTPEQVVTAGGWCAPSGVHFDTGVDWGKVYFPLMQTPRGGIKFEPLSGADLLERDAMRSMVARLAERLVRQRHETIEEACRTAGANGWDVIVYDAPKPLVSQNYETNSVTWMAYTGISFTEAQHGIPTLNYHQSPDWWDDDDYEE